MLVICSPRASQPQTIWSRMPERKPRQSKKKAVTAEELNALIASATVYTADQVDRAAQVDSAVPVEAYYPDSLKSNHVSGVAVVEFVVDTEGRVETETINVGPPDPSDPASRNREIVAMRS